MNDFERTDFGRGANDHRGRGVIRSGVKIADGEMKRAAFGLVSIPRYAGDGISGPQPSHWHPWDKASYPVPPSKRSLTAVVPCTGDGSSPSTMRFAVSRTPIWI